MKVEYEGREHPYKILVYSTSGWCRMVRLKPKDREPNHYGLTAIFKITYHSKRK